MKKRKSWKRILSTVLTLALVMAMIIPNTGNTVHAVSKRFANQATATTYDIKVGEQITLTATGDKVLYKSLNRRIARVSKDGVVTGRKEGTTKILVTTMTKRNVRPPRTVMEAIFQNMFLGLNRQTTKYIINVKAQDGESEETTESSETTESTEPSEEERPVKPENPSEADEYYWDNSKEVIAVINAKESTEVSTETEALNMLENRGFGDCPVMYEYSIDGEYCDETQLVDGSDAKRPMYLAFYEAESGDVWTIYVTNGKVMAYPASYNLESDLPTEVIFSESEEITSYDDKTNQFYVTIPKESTVTLKVVDRIDAETLNKLTIEEISK